MTDRISIAKIALAAHRACPEPHRTLLVDKDLAEAIASIRDGGPNHFPLSEAVEVFDLPSHGLDPSELWAHRPAEPYRLAIVSARRSARDLLQVLIGLDPVITPGGKILILPSVSESESETRAEATEVFCGAYPAWERGLAVGFVVELWKTGATSPARDDRARVEARPRALVRLLRQPDRDHTLGLCEVAEGIAIALERLGYDTTFVSDRLDLNFDPIEGNRLTVVFGADAYPEAAIPGGAIIYNLEQIAVRGETFPETPYGRLLQHHVVWDYSKKNVADLQKFGIRAVHCPIGYVPEQRRISAECEQDIDVLHYGAPVPRRVAILDALRAAKVDGRPLHVVHLFGKYGPERDALIARAKIVLNLHAYEPAIWEAARCSYLLANGRLVVSESGGVDPELEALATDTTAAVPYDKIVETCLAHLQDPLRRKLVADRGRLSFAQETSQVGAVWQALAETVKNGIGPSRPATIAFPSLDSILDETVLGKPLADTLREALPKEGEKFAGPILGSVFGKAISLPMKVTHIVPAKRVVSIAVFGDHRFGSEFWQRMPDYVENYVLAHHALFPGYELRIVHDEHLFHANAGDTLCALARQNLVKLVYLPSRPGQGKCERMLGRLAAAWDPDVAYAFSRDVDSLPTWKDRCAVEEFIAAAEAGEVDLHTISDSPSHGGMLGGLCGVRAAWVRQKWPTHDAFIQAAGYSDEKWAEHGADQDWLNQIVCGASLEDARVFEHCLFKEQQGGLRKPGPSSWVQGDVPGVARWGRGPVRYATEVGVNIAGARVPADVLDQANCLVKHLGSSGYNVERARAFYERYSPISPAVNRATEINPGTSDRVVLGCDENDHYSFHLPLTCLLWAQRIYQPLVLLVGEPADWLSDPRRALEVERARETGAEIYWLGRPPEGARSSTVAQVARIFGVLTPGVRADDWLVTADVDMWPIGEWITGGPPCASCGGRGVEHGHIGHFFEPTPLTLWYSNAYAGDSYPHYPMCYVGGTATVWREMVRTAETGDLQLKHELQIVSETRAAVSKAPADTDGAWNYDERLLGQMIARYEADHPGTVERIDRHFVEGEWRLDRAAWDDGLKKLQGTLKGIADAHLLRPGYTDENWAKLRPVLELALDPKWLRWAEEYRKEWLNR